MFRQSTRHAAQMPYAQELWQEQDAPTGTIRSSRGGLLRSVRDATLPLTDVTTCWITALRHRQGHVRRC